MNTAYYGWFTFDPFDAPVFVESVKPVEVMGTCYDEVKTRDAGTFIATPADVA